MNHEPKAIRTAICSFGMSGKLFHAPFIESHPGFELAGIVERHRSDSRDLYPASKLYRSVEELCEDKSLELVVVNTPTHLHFEQAKSLLDAGKHIIIEKPFTVTVNEAKALDEIAKSKNLFLSVYQNRRYDGDFRAVKKVIADNLLGDLREAEIKYERYRPVPTGKSHKEGDLPGAGLLFDLSPHIVDQAILLFGFPKAIFADIWTMREHVIAPDYFELLFYYDRLRVRLRATCVALVTTFSYVIHGMKGSFLQHRSDLQEQQLLEGAKPSLNDWCKAPGKPDGILNTELNGEHVRKETTAQPGNYMGYYDEVYRAMRENAPNPVPAADGIRNMRVIEGALESLRTKSIVEFE